MMNENSNEAQDIRILNSADVFAVMQEILLRENKIDRDMEHFWIIGLADNHEILFIEWVGPGGVGGDWVEPTNVFRVAVLKNAVKVILVHNRPSGELNPSLADKDMTERLIQVGRIIQVEVIEHLIISTESYLSFVDTGLFEELKQSMKWMPAFEIEEKIRREEQTIREEAVKSAEEEGLKEKAIEMAKSLKEQKVEISIIVKASGLSAEEIEKL